MTGITIKRTTSGDADFIVLIQMLDHELWNELEEDQATYDQHNKVPGINTAIVVYDNNTPVACGCYKPYNSHTAEIKRMYVKKDFRGKGYSKKVLAALETWAIENGFTQALLETSIHFDVAQTLYTSNGYHVIDNYPPYTGLPESVCMQKQLIQ
jgi:putative acetyltransferase